MRLLPLALVVLVAVGGCSSGGSHAATALPSVGDSPHTVYDVAYAKADDKERLDLYLPAPADRPAPLVVWIHGGGWRTGDKGALATPVDLGLTPPKPQSCNQVVEVQVPDLATLLARGYAVAAVNYRLTGDPVVALKDVKAAVRFLRAGASRYHLDPDRFAAWGDSAGGYNAIMLGVTGGQHTEFDDASLGDAGVPDTVQAVIDWFGPTDAASMPGNPGPAESPYTYVTAEHAPPPFMIAHGDADCVVPVQQSQHLRDALTQAHGVAALAVLPGANHEDPAFMRTQWKPTLAFLDHTFGRG
jgi:acetyl esterase/lipase